MLISSKIYHGINGEIKIPGDKSISHRAVMCASIASGSSKLKGFLQFTPKNPKVG